MNEVDRLGKELDEAIRDGMPDAVIEHMRHEYRKASDGNRREMIAVAAMQGLLAAGDSLSYKELADMAVRCADALMAELAKSKGKSS